MNSGTVGTLSKQVRNLDAKEHAQMLVDSIQKVIEGNFTGTDDELSTLEWIDTSVDALVKWRKEFFSGTLDKDCTGCLCSTCASTCICNEVEDCFMERCDQYKPLT